ncbi:MAG TPA: transporter substrate-binding domain-containing protein, partial [Thiolapillus brandeum]|nr:transporter substrate-binding domain-containing protein [Thiolapillus brandeum]
MFFPGKDRSGGRCLFSSRWFLLLLLLAWALPSTPEVRTVSVGVYQNSPKVFIDEQGRPAGFFIELLEGVAAREGWRLHYVPCEWKRCLELLEEGEIQLMPDVAFSRERERRFAFGREVALSSWSVFYTDSKKPLFSLKALDGEKVAVVRNSIQYQALRELVKELGIRPVYLETDDMGEVFRLVHTGQARAGLVNTYFGRRNAAEFGLVESSVLVRPTLLYIAA